MYDIQYEYKFGEYLRYYSKHNYTIKYVIDGTHGQCTILTGNLPVLTYTFLAEWNRDYSDPMVGRDPFCLMPSSIAENLRKLAGWREIRYGPLEWSCYRKTHRVKYVDGALKDGFYVCKKEDSYYINVSYHNGRLHWDCLIKKDVIKYECSFSNGCLHGKLTVRTHDTFVLSENYLYGVLHGECVYSDYKKCNYLYGLLHGDYFEYLHGKVQVHAIYAQDKLNGPKETYHPNGELRMRVMHRDGVPIGVHEEYDDVGDLCILGYYKNGKLIIVREWEDGSLRYEVTGPETGLQKHITYINDSISSTWHTYQGKRQGRFRVFLAGSLRYSYNFEDDELYGAAVEVNTSIRCNFRKSKIFGTMEIGNDTIDVYDDFVFGSWTVSNMSYDNNTGVFISGANTTLIGKNAVFHIHDILNTIKSSMHRARPMY
jgi:antitoxin component YwqK of YwqJK toxin-antitoxin module